MVKTWRVLLLEFGYQYHLYIGCAIKILFQIKVIMIADCFIFHLKWLTNLQCVLSHIFAVHFHNDFLLAILAKCQALGSTPGVLMVLVVTNAIFFSWLQYAEYCFDPDLVHIAWCVKWKFIILLTCESNSFLFERFYTRAIAYIWLID